MKELCASLSIAFDYPEFLVIDACAAEYNAANIKKIEANIKKIEHKRLIPPEHYEEVLDDIRKLHYSFEIEYESNKKLILDKWRSWNGMDEFREYFVKIWLTGNNTKWQIFHTPPGFASTANPCESFNGKLKELFTGRERLSVQVFIQIALDQLAPFYSTNHRRKSQTSFR